LQKAFLDHQHPNDESAQKPVYFFNTNLIPPLT
jgi:hypothetical protein